MPGTLQLVSGDDDISLNTGGLLYRVPLYRFPGGPGSLPMDVGLVYNSFIWETSPCTNPGCSNTQREYTQSTTGGGWSYSFDYQLTIESAAVNTLRTIEYRVTVIFPDGSNHVLRPKGISPDSAFSGFYPTAAPGSASTTPYPYLTDDGTNARVEISSSSSQIHPPWKLFLADGTTASYDPTANSTCPNANYGLGGSISDVSDYVIYANKIADRNGNFLTVCASTSYVNTLEPSVTITDQAGRIAKLAYNLNSQDDVLTAPGANGQLLTWNVNWNTFTSTYYDCGGSSCTSPVSMIQSIQLPQVKNENLQYQLTYGSSALQLQSVAAPYGATVSYAYGTIVPVGRDPLHLNASVIQKTISWTDPWA
jgi:hypothetical protein